MKALLRAGQAHMGLGPAEYSSAAAFLQQALEQAKQQQLPTQGLLGKGRQQESDSVCWD